MANEKKLLPPTHLKPKFSNEQTVYPKCDPNQYPRFISGIIIRPGDQIKYLATDHAGEMEFYEFELSATKILMP